MKNLFIFCFLISFSFLNSGNYTLVRKGKPNCVIVISEKPKKAVQLASYELQHHIKLITGAEIPIVKDTEGIKGLKIILGENKYTEKLELGKDLETQEYIIKFLPDSIILLGKDKDDYGKVKYNTPDAYTTFPDFFDPQGTLYAVYDFLERFCGVRWFNPTDYGTCYPEKKTLIIRGKDIRNQPYFIGRYIWPTMFLIDWYDIYVSCLWKKSKKSYPPGDTDPDYLDYLEWENIAYKRLKEEFKNMNEYINVKRCRVKLFLLRMRLGGEKRTANHSLYHYYKKYPPNEYPEIWAKGYGDKPTQLCYTSEKLIELVSKEAEEYFKLPEEQKQWGPNVFAVEPMDNRAFCKCERCEELIKKGKSYPGYSTGEHSELHFYFVNEIAKNLKKTNPDKMIITLAYASHAKYPETVKLESNIEVMFCCVSGGPVADEKYSAEAYLFKEWAENCQKEKRPLGVWLYYNFPKERADLQNYYTIPAFSVRSKDKQFKIFKNYNIRNAVILYYGHPEVDAYVTYRLLLNPDEDVEKLLDEYFGCLYGKAKSEMKKIYNIIEIGFKNYLAFDDSSDDFQWKYGLTKEGVDKIKELLEKAKSKTTNEKEINNIKLFEYGIYRYIEKGFNDTQRKNKELASLPKLIIKIPKVEKVNDLKNIDWTKAAKLYPWYKRLSTEAVERRIEGEILHDGENIYLKLTDWCDTEKLQESSIVFPCDDWEIFFAKKRKPPYRQIAFNHKGTIVVLSQGEIEDKRNYEIKTHGVEVIPIIEKDKWISIVKIPLKDVVLEGVKPDETIYMNIIRVASLAISKSKGADPVSVETLIPYSNVHQPERFAEVKFEK